MKLPKFLEWRKFSLPMMGVLFRILKLITFRDRNLWAFGCWIGKKYDDNAKFLFEYVNKNHSNIRCVWLTRNKNVVAQVRQLGYEAYLSSSFKGVMMSLRCGVAIMTNGLDDFGAIPLVGGAKIVALWHGVGGFKKIYNENYSGLKLNVKRTVDAVFNWVGRDISLGTSEYTAERVMEQFDVKRDSIVITGQPRNDLFREKMERSSLVSNVDFDSYSKVVLYMPTYRVSPNTHRDTVKDILQELSSSEKFQDYLKKENILFLVKLHPLTQFAMKSDNCHFQVLGDKQVRSVQHLLMAADCLVTDYSSCSVDYALLNRPIVFYVPDEADYLSYSSLNDAYGRVVTDKALNVDDLIEKISAGDIASTKQLNDLFEDASIVGTCYSENMYRAICNQCNLEVV
ncbi:CDP-glycerol glycerophosphotransferase family protein [Fibrobacter succinogenes]|uniref:CDP-glycerol glycerophosphotransferase family protein n=1 Tax=Fibrobacter succinogenes TaxID=833 RepID=UPI0013D438A5|nr:CDP-glycerol glycerophosphotransferase family protein [Fibrobacter succinogenes]